LVGGNATDHSLNLRYPFLNISSQRLTFLGSPTHNSNGITYAASGNQSIITGFTRLYLPSQDLNFCIYSRTNNSVTANDISCVAQSPFDIFMRIKDASNNILSGDGGIYSVVANPNDSTGLYTVNSIIGTSASKVIMNGNTSTPLNTGTSGAASNLTAVQMGLGTSKNIAFYGIGLSLTDTQMQDDYTQIQALQTAFSRQV
jgi:hypothetical protein